MIWTKEIKEELSKEMERRVRGGGMWRRTARI